jgi:hypothetical protein
VASGVWFSMTRLIVGLFLLLLAHRSPEANMLVGGDLPTVSVYWLLQSLGVQWSIAGAADIKFLIVGLIVWFVIGVVFAAVYLSIAHQRPASSRDPG